MPSSDLGAGLVAEHSTRELRVACRPAGFAVRFTADEDRTAAALEFGSGRVSADVSFQPGAIVAALDHAAREAGVDPNRWRSGLLRALCAWRATALDWCTLEPANLLTAIGALTHPFLANAYRHGCAPLVEVPRWALPVMRSSDAMSASRRLTGGTTNRRVARALAASLVDNGAQQPVRLAPLAFATVAAGLVSVDELAAILEPPHGADSAPPTCEEVRAARRGLALLPAGGRRSLLITDALSTRSVASFARVMTHLWWARDQVPPPLPVRVDDIAALCARHVPCFATPSAEPTADPSPARARPADHAPTSDVRAPRTPVVAATPVRTTHHRAAVRALAPPVARAETPPRWPVPEALRAIHRLQRDDLTFVAPTSVAELVMWGRLLHNCLGSFTTAVHLERSYIIGIDVRDELIGCVEVTPSTRHVRQILGRANRTLAPQIHDSVLRALAETGVIPPSTTAVRAAPALR